MSDDKPAGARSLVSSVLQKLDSAPAPESEAAPDPPPADPAEEARELIDVYFELESPSERDALFDRLVALDTPVVTEFLGAMFVSDEDEYVRAAAAAELARRGNAEAIASLEADLADPEEQFFFEHAVQVLSEFRGVG